MKATGKLKIMIFAHDSSLYGASLSLLTLLKGFNENNFAEVLVLLPNKGKMESVFSENEIPYQVVSFPRCFTQEHSKNIFQRFKNGKKYKQQEDIILPDLKNIAGQFKPDLIYSNTSIISIGDTLANMLNLPHVWHIREFGDLDYNFEYLPSRKGLIKKMKRATRLIFISGSLRKHWMDGENSNASLIYNGLVKVASHYPEKSYPANNFRFGMLGAILPGKGQDLAIRAIALLSKRYSALTLFIYGNVADRPYHDQLLKMIKEFGCESNIIFKPFEENQDLIYNNLDVLLNCSVMEGFGRTIVEAMSRGIPVIANASGGPLEIIQPKVNGLLFDHTAESLAESMSSLMEDNELYSRISKQGKQDAEKLYTETAYVNAVSEVLEKAIGSKELV
jgi:glycosyltransferase involved in cell wall biosynthesis